MKFTLQCWPRPEFPARSGLDLAAKAASIDQASDFCWFLMSLCKVTTKAWYSSSPTPWKSLVKRSVHRRPEAREGLAALGRRMHLAHPQVVLARLTADQPCSSIASSIRLMVDCSVTVNSDNSLTVSPGVIASTASVRILTVVRS